MIKNTKSATAMNTFLNFIARTFESYIEQYPLTQFKSIINQYNQLNQDQTLREQIKLKILKSIVQKKSFIKGEIIKLDQKLEEKLKQDIRSVENDMICKFKKETNKSMNDDLFELYKDQMMNV